MDRDTQPGAKERKPQDPLAAGQKEEDETRDTVPEKQKIQAGLLSAAVAALLVGIALIVYIVTLNSRPDDTAAGDTVERLDDDVAPVENKADGLKDSSKSRSDMDDVPSLAPTPEGAIIGRDLTSGTATTGKKGTKKGQMGGSAGGMTKKAAEEQTATPALETSVEHNKAAAEKGADDKKDPADEKAAPKKKDEPAKKSTPKKISPKKLDDNPF
jgi:hypothetical protein